MTYPLDKYPFYVSEHEATNYQKYYILYRIILPCELKVLEGDKEVRIKRQIEMIFIFSVFLTMILGIGLLTLKTHSNNNVTMNSAMIRITSVNVVTDLSDGDYTLQVGVKSKRILGSNRGVFQFSDNNYKSTAQKWYTYPETIEGGNTSAGIYYNTDLNTDWCYTVELTESGFEYYVSFKLKKGWGSETHSFYLGGTDNSYDTNYWTCNVWFGKYGAHIRFQYQFILNA